MGYFVTVLVYREVGPAEYVWFAAYWATLFLVIGTLSGVEQELARGTKKAKSSDPKPSSPATQFALGLAGLVIAVTITTSTLWAEPLLGDQGQLLVWPFAVGASGIVLVAALGGTLYGLSKWNLLALMISLDATIRVSLLAIALLFTDDLVVLAWCVSIPFPLTIAVLWPMLRKGIYRQTEVDVTLGKLTWNVARTVVASASSALIITGIPTLVVYASQGSNLIFTGQLILTLTLLRAPLTVVAVSLQSFLVVKFRDQRSSGAKIMVSIQIGLILVTLILAWIGLTFGPALLSALSDDVSLITGEIVALTIVSSGLLAMMIVLAASLLAQGNHFFYSLGWLFSALATVLIILGPGELTDRVISAILIGPLVGLGIFALATALTPKIGKSSLART